MRWAALLACVVLAACARTIEETPAVGDVPAATIVQTCPAPPVRSDFEHGIDPAWQVTDPSAFRLETGRPIAGQKSLRIAFRQKISTLTIPLRAACAVRLSFSLRADAQLLQSQVTIARIAAGPGAWVHLTLSAMGLALAQETRTPTAFGLLAGGPFGRVTADVPDVVVVSVDPRTGTIAASVASVGAAAPEPTLTATDLPGPITSIDIGAAHGIQSDGVGILVLDDLTIE